MVWSRGGAKAVWECNRFERRAEILTQIHSISPKNKSFTASIKSRKYIKILHILYRMCLSLSISLHHRAA